MISRTESMISRKESIIYELPQELLNNLRLRILENQEILKKSQNSVEVELSI